MVLKPVVLDADNHQIHIAVHNDREKEPSFQQLSIEVQKAYAMHKMQHEQMMAQQQQQQMMQSAQMSAMTGQPAQPPQAPPDPTQQQEKIRKGPGITAKTKNAMDTDLAPFGIGSRG